MNDTPSYGQNVYSFVSASDLQLGPVTDPLRCSVKGNEWDRGLGHMDGRVSRVPNPPSSHHD